MKTLLMCLSLAAAMLLASCSQLPDASARPKLEITEVSIANKDGVSGFDISYTIYHRALEPLELQGVKTSVFVNNKIASDYMEDVEDIEIPGSREQSFTVFVPANVMNETESRALGSNPLLVVDLSCAITLIFSKSKEALDFNPSASYEGYVGHGL